MTLLQLLLSSGFIFLNILTTFESNLTFDKLPNYIIPNHYNILLYQETNFFNGTCDIFITISDPTRNIGFHAQKPHLEINDYVLTKINSSSFYTPKNSTYYNENHIFDVVFADELIPGHYILRLNFTTYLNSDGKGLFKTNYSNEEYVHKTLQFAMLILDKVKKHMESHYNYCMKFAKIDHAAIPNLLFDTIQNPGLIFYRETTLIRDTEVDSAARKIDLARLIGREMAHQCFNNFGNPFWWSTSWFNEGTAMLFAVDAINKIYSEHISHLIVVQVQQESLRLDTESIMKHLSSEAGEIYSLSPFSYYIKAPAILRMLQHMLTAEVFWNGIEMYLKNIFHERKEKIVSTVTSDYNYLWYKMIDALYDSRKVHRFALTTVMDPWIEINSYPIIKVECYNSNLKVFIENKHALSREVTIYLTTQRYSYANDTSIYDDQWLPRISSNETYKILNFRDFDWIIANVQQVGYYRVNYDSSYWDAIIHYLRKYPNKMEIHVLNRAQIIDDAFYFLMNNQLPLKTFLELTKYLQRETHFVAWYPMIKALEHISGFFLFDDSINITIHMRNILHGLLEKIGYKFFLSEIFLSENDLTKCLQQEAAKWACFLGDSVCKSNATSKLKQYLYDVTTEKIFPWWKKWTYCNGLMSDENMWLQTFTEWKNMLNMTLLEYLSCSKNPYIIIDYLIEIDKSIKCDLEDPDCRNVEMHDGDHAISFLFIVAKHAKDDTVLEHILNMFEEIKPRKVSTYVALIIIINHVYYKKQLDKISEKVGYLTNNLSTIDMSLVERKIYKRLSEIKNQRSYFQNLI